VGDQGVFQTAPRLVRGNLGEKLGTEALASMGHTILMYKPSILGTNQGGIDMVTRHNGVLHLVDNKALTRSGNVSSVSALTTNFTQNLAATRAELALAAADPARPPAERAIFQQAVNDIDSGNYVRVVTNANVAPDNQVPTGVTQNLTNQGIGFIDVR
jgi:Holliday junction resolvase-like predicted endonuclease